MADIFLSYKRDDQDTVQALANALSEAGFRVWWDQEIRTGATWERDLRREVREAPCFIGVWTTNSVETDGLFKESATGGENWLRLEHQWAGRDRIIGALIERSSIPAVYEDVQHVDLSDWVLGDKEHSGFQLLIERATELAIPDFVKNAHSKLESELETAERQAKFNRERADRFQAESSNRLDENVRIGEEMEAYRRAWDVERTGLATEIESLQNKLEDQRQGEKGIKIELERFKKNVGVKEDRIRSLVENAKTEQQARLLAEERLKKTEQDLSTLKRESSDAIRALTREVEKARSSKSNEETQEHFGVDYSTINQVRNGFATLGGVVLAGAIGLILLRLSGLL